MWLKLVAGGTLHATPFPLFPQASLGPLRSVEKRKRVTLRGRLFSCPTKSTRARQHLEVFQSPVRHSLRIECVPNVVCVCVYMIWFRFLTTPKHTKQAHPVKGTESRD